MSRKNISTAKCFADLFSYDDVDGSIRWLVPRPKRKVGDEAGSIRSDGRYKTVHATICGKKKRYYAHRIIWELNNGKIPKDMCIDHIDGNGINNHINNLRLVTRSENQRNSRLPKNNTSGQMNIHKHNDGAFNVAVCGKYIGRSKNIAEAISMRDLAQKGFSCHQNHGRLV